MRNVDRLDDIYNTIKDLHKKYFPDWRIMQLINNFYIWHYYKFKSDGYYLEEEEFIARFKNFVKEITNNDFD